MIWIHDDYLKLGWVDLDLFGMLPATTPLKVPRNLLLHEGMSSVIWMLVLEDDRDSKFGTCYYPPQTQPRRYPTPPGYLPSSMTSLGAKEHPFFSYICD